jgi:hypothetical protein
MRSISFDTPINSKISNIYTWNITRW